jgi:hypothetical protein
MAKKSKNNHRAAEIGAGAVAAAALAVAGGYILWDRMGKQKQAKVKAWVANARKEAAQKVAMAKKKLSEVQYKQIVDAAVERYGSLANVDRAELEKTAATLKAEWQRIQKQAKTVAKQLREKHTMSRKPAKKTTRSKKRTARA